MGALSEEFVARYFEGARICLNRHRSRALFLNRLAVDENKDFSTTEKETGRADVDSFFHGVSGHVKSEAVNHTPFEYAVEGWKYLPLRRVVTFTRSPTWKLKTLIVSSE